MKAVIFDLDGVILSTDGLHYEAWKKIADKENIYFDKKINERLRGVSRMASLDIILERRNREYSQEEKEALAERKNDIYKELLKTLTPLDVFDKVVDTINALKANGIKVAIGSSSKNTKSILTQVNMIDMFDAISDGTNISKSKPDPEVFLKAAQMIGVDPKECVVVEDAEAGLQAAKAGGMLAIAVNAAKGNKYADYSLDDMSLLLNIVQ